MMVNVNHVLQTNTQLNLEHVNAIAVDQVRKSTEPEQDANYVLLECTPQTMDSVKCVLLYNLPLIPEQHFAILATVDLK